MLQQLTRKTTAMLLILALSLAMGVTAFADTDYAEDVKEYVSDVEQIKLGSALAAEDAQVTTEADEIMLDEIIYQHNLLEASDTILTLQENDAIGSLRSERNNEEPTRIGDLLNANIKHMSDSGNIIHNDASSLRTFSERGSTDEISPTSIGNGFYQVLSDFLTFEGENKFIFPIPVQPGEVLNIQLDVPNSANIDYDAYLFEVDALGNMTLVDFSEYSTFINGTHGTLSEAVGAFNVSNTTKNYAFFVQSFIGASSTQPFTIHVGIRANAYGFDQFESDENSRQAIPFTLSQSGATLINVRSANTMCDNDWYTFTTPSNLRFNTARFFLDSTSNSANYRVEVYTRTNSNQMIRQAANNNGRVSLASNTTYFIRVTSTGASSLTGADYVLTISPDFVPDQVIITNFAGGEWVAYNGVPGYRVNGNSTITVQGVVGQNGFVLPNATVTVTVVNDSWSAPSQRYRVETVTTNSNGQFSVDLHLEHSTGRFSAIVGSARPFVHYFDIGSAFAVSGNAISNIELIYIFAFSVML
jgi:hypothetical protein